MDQPEVKRKRLSKNLLQMKEEPKANLKFDVVSTNLDGNPTCVHGPTVLFENPQKRFFACSAYRDRKGCSFYHKADEKITKAKTDKWNDVARTWRLDEMSKIEKKWRSRDCLKETGETAKFCQTCSLFTTQHESHKEHQVIEELSSEDLHNPIKRLATPLQASKHESQYHFTDEVLKVIAENAMWNNVTGVICMGAPTVHHYLTKHTRIKSILLDIDTRLAAFFQPGQDWCWYNMFNHFFFDPNHRKRYTEFIQSFDSGELLVICDPPFGGKCELLSASLRGIEKDWKSSGLKIMLIMPYFMEGKIAENRQDLRMSDYQVNYINHSSFSSGQGGRKAGSPVRIFTNIPLIQLTLPAEEGYKYCSKCSLWTFKGNRHCDKCKSCTSKSGAPYKHCNRCQRCVKQSWTHCQDCNRCALKDHPCHLFKAKKSK